MTFLWIQTKSETEENIKNKTEELTKKIKVGSLKGNLHTMLLREQLKLQRKILNEVKINSKIGNERTLELLKMKRREHGILDILSAIGTGLFLFITINLLQQALSPNKEDNKCFIKITVGNPDNS